MDIDSNVLAMVIQLPHKKQNQYNHTHTQKKKTVRGGEGTVPYNFKHSFLSAMSKFCNSQSKILKRLILSKLLDNKSSSKIMYIFRATDTQQ
jgi:hypothetical protein